MMVLVLEKVPASLRGELTRWLLEPKTGVFVGRVSAQVRDLLWEMVEDKLKQGGGFLFINRMASRGSACGRSVSPSGDWWISRASRSSVDRLPRQKRRTSRFAIDRDGSGEGGNRHLKNP